MIGAEKKGDGLINSMEKHAQVAQYFTNENKNRILISEMRSIRFSFSIFN
jgi:hypothetical protein